VAHGEGEGSLGWLTAKGGSSRQKLTAKAAAARGEVEGSQQRRRLIAKAKAHG